jgi:DNA polymerase-3 subunit gamma/tau
LIDVPQDQLNHMADPAMRLGIATLTRCAEIVHTALIEMRGTTSPRLVLELLCARMLLPDASSDAAALLHRLERLERRITASADEGPGEPPTLGLQEPAPSGRATRAKPTTRTPAKSSAAAKARSAAPAERPEGTERPEPRPSAGALDAAALRRLWPEVLDVVKQSSRRTRALLDNAQITDVTGEQVSLSAPAALAKMISEESNTSALRAALTKVVGGEWKIAISGAMSAAAAETAIEPDPRADDDDPPGTRPAGEPVDSEAEALRLLREQFDARPFDG